MLALIVSTVILLAILYIVAAAFKPGRLREKMRELIKEKEGIEIPIPSGYFMPSVAYLGKYLDPPRVMYYRELFKPQYRSLWLKVCGITLFVYMGIGVLGTTIEEINLQSGTFSLAPAVWATNTPTRRRVTINQPAPPFPQVQTTTSIMAATGCKEWNSLTSQDDSKVLCAYGVISSIEDRTKKYCQTVLVGKEDYESEKEFCNSWTGDYWVFRNTKFPSPPYLYTDSPKRDPVDTCV